MAALGSSRRMVPGLAETRYSMVLYSLAQVTSGVWLGPVRHVLADVGQLVAQSVRAGGHGVLGFLQRLVGVDEQQRVGVLDGVDVHHARGVAGAGSRLVTQDSKAL
jgi:hypothetical protein